MKEKAAKLMELFGTIVESIYSDEKSACADSPLYCLNTNDLKVLLSLRDKENPGIKDIANELSLPMSTLTGIFNKLVSRGLVDRERCISDRRVVRVNLTEKGLEAALQKQKRGETIAVSILNKLDESEQSQLLNLLSKITSS